MSSQTTIAERRDADIRGRRAACRQRVRRGATNGAPQVELEYLASLLDRRSCTKYTPWANAMPSVRANCVQPSRKTLCA
jgi:hypothetical protein